MSKQCHISRRLSVALVVALVATAGLAVCVGPATAQEEPTEAFVVDLEESGDATVTLVVTYDLASDDERAAFDGFRENTSDHADRYGDRLTRIADRTAAETGREMRVTEARATVETVDDVGVVRLSVDWAGLAAVTDDRLVLDEPFESGFDPDRSLVVIGPDGYTVSETTVAPSTTNGDVAQFSAETDLSGFEVTLVPDGGETDATAPTPLVAVLALLSVAVVGYGGWHRLF